MKSIAIALLALCATAHADSSVPPAVAAPEGPRWEDRYDFDGDGRPDRVEVRYSGGGHCCYYLRMHLSSKQRPVALPFELDGGYVMGLDLSRPDHFDVRDTDGDGAADLVMEIATYAGRDEAIPYAWAQDWGVYSHRIVVHFRRGKITVENPRSKLK